MCIGRIQTAGFAENCADENIWI